MMARNFMLLLCFHLSSFGSSQFFEGITSQQTPGASTRSQPSPLIRQVGNLLLDFDEAFYKITAPKVQLEQDLEEQKIRNAPDPIRSYFDRVRENYKNLQSKIGSTLEQSEGRFQLPNLFDINYQNRGPKSTVGVSLPFLPLNIQVNAKSSASKNTGAEAESESESAKITSDVLEKQPVSESSKIDIKVKDTENKKEESLAKDSNGSPGEFQKRSSSKFQIQSTKSNSLRQSTENFKVKPSWEAKEHSRFPPSEKANEPLQIDSMIQGRILGDLLYSESTFDKYFRSLLKNFKWLVDPSIFPAKELVENIRGITTGQFINNSKNNTDSEEDTFVTRTPQKVPSGLKQRKPNLEIEDTASVKHQSPHSGPDRNSEVIVAFTPEGIPLKLKVNSHSKNPLKFLHETLSSAGISLNIPIESHRHIHPVGKDILRLGSIPKGTEAKAIFVDTTDRRQLKSLIKNLKKYKMDD